MSARVEPLAPEVEHDPFAGAALARVVPTTEPQREVWLADKLGRDASLAFNESVSLRFSGTLDVEALRQAVQDLLGRHEALRATLAPEGDQLLIAAETPIEIRIHDHRGQPPAEQATRLAAARNRAVEEPFDLERGPLFRAELHALGADDHVLLLTAHHIVCDGWSFGVLVRDLAALYAQRAGTPAPAPAPAASFSDYAARQAQAESSDERLADERFWLSRFPGTAPVLDLPTDRPRPAFRTFASRREDYTLDAALVAEARRAGARQGASLFATLLAAFAALLNRISGASDVVVGVPAAGQSTGGFETLVGHCVNLLPLRVAVDPLAEAGSLVGATQSAILDAYEHQGYTYGTLLRKLAIARDPSRLPLASVMFNLDQALDPNAAGFAGLRVDLASNPRSFENFELFVNAVQVGGALRLECQYNADLFDGATVRRWLAGYEALLRSACAAPGTPVGRLAFATDADRETLARWNATAAAYDREACVHALIEAQARRVPDAVALTGQGESIRYADLDARANRLARALRERGVRRGTLAGLHVRRGPGMVVAMLAVLKAGGAYVPLDPAYPAERLAFMARDAGLAVLVSEGASGAALDWPRERTLLLDEDAARIASQESAPLAADALAATPQDAAYVIYTSGSTGKPKGVQVPHRAVANFLASMAREPGILERDRLLAVTTLSFDIAVTELLLPLSVGAGIVLASPEEAADGAALAALIGAHGVTVMQATPATWRLLLEAGWPGSASLRALCGGEALGADLARALLGRCAQLWNMYGPTETTVWSTCRRVAPGSGTITIGRPIANTTAWILDERREVCPVGVPGEICIGGDGVATGYLGRPDLTAERFIPDPFSKVSGARLYRTGDRGRWRADGELEHLGRLDFQVKVRGYRIELGEIEAALADYPGITQAVAVAREDRPGDVRLVAYLVATSGADTGEESLKAHLRRTLPAYMVPQHFLSLPAIPRLPNGKIDRRSLPAPQVAARGEDFVAPRDALEKAVAAEMEATLGLPGIGVDDDFFALGGHSLLAAQLTARLNRALGTRLGMRTLFASPTIAKLAQAIREATGATFAAHQAIARLADRTRAPLSLMQERLFFLEELYPGRVTYNAPSAHRLRGPFDAAAFQRAFDEMLRRQPSLRTSFEREGAVIAQRIHDGLTVPLFPAEDLSALPAPERERRLLERLEALTAQTFDLARAPLFAARLFRLGPEEHVLFFMPHHIVWDGWSFDLLYDEMAALYGAFSQGRPSPLPELPVSYGDFAAWHREWTEGPEFAGQLDFWRRRLERVGRLAELPTDKPRRPGMSGAGDTEWISVDAARVDALHALAQRAGTTVFVVTLAAYAALLHGHSGQSSLVLGTPVRGRNAPEVEGVMGYFNNLVPLHLAIDPGQPFMALVDAVKATVVEGFAAPDVPLERIARELPAAQGARGAMLYQALFSFQDARQRITQWGGLSHEVIPLFQRGATEDLGMWFVETARGLHGGVTFNTDILTAETAKELHRGYVALLDAMLADPGQSVRRLLESAAVRPARRDAGASPRPARSPARTAPATDTERALAQIWCEQLKLPAVGVEDNFFDLGGHSLLAMQAILAMESRTGKRADRNRYIFETLGQIARAYDEAPAEGVARKKGLRGMLSGLMGPRK